MEDEKQITNSVLEKRLEEIEKKVANFDKNLTKKVKTYAVDMEDLNALYKRIKNELWEQPDKLNELERQFNILGSAFEALIKEFDEWKQKYFIDDKSSRTHLANARF